MANRILWVDAVRGFAIVLMVIFHFSYDLKYFGYVDWDVPNGTNWRPFRYVILTLFIFTVGVSLSLAHAKTIRWRAFWIRLAQLAAASAVITTMSLFMFPNGWIYFGILHFITFASLFGLMFIRVPLAALGVGAFILIGYWTDALSVRWPFDLIAHLLPSHTEDYVSLFPWLGVALLGVGLSGIMPINRFDLPKNKAASGLSFLGRHGLIIYLVHQPLLFGGFLAVGYLSSS